MRFLLFAVLPTIATVGCTHTKADRRLAPPKVEEFALPPADGRTTDPPAYPEEKKNPFLPKKSELPQSFRDAGGGPGGGAGAGSSGPIKGGASGIGSGGP